MDWCCNLISQTNIAGSSPPVHIAAGRRIVPCL
ncbi:hypothetical protein Zm00014a_036184 [Zea mays]|uniref:Uncharacterized protein n=1 Tax=Zea mays TaxID=4577 RepID=A0A3L6E5M9_MAIZE|nr:hypothetical protein Zm00014a_036184 [Zea mays]